MAIKKRWIALGATVLVAACGYAAFERYWYYLPGLIDRIKDPVYANRPVRWAPGPTTAPAHKPNVVFILADDLGFNDLSFNGGGGGVASGAMATPRINSIAREGVTFNNRYDGNATCASSRAAIMTGRYATRFGFEFTPTPQAFERYVGHFNTGIRQPIYHSEWEADLPPVDQEEVPRNEIMIPALLKAKGYH